MTFSQAFSNLFEAIQSIYSYFPATLQVVLLAMFGVVCVACLLRILMSL